MNEMAVLSSCCGAVRYVEPVFLNVRREDGSLGRKKIGEVVCCGNAKEGYGQCPRRAMGDPRSTTRLRILPKAWDLMMERHSWPPYYFTDLNGELFPETMAPAVQGSPIRNPAPKEAAPPQNVAPTKTSPADGPQEEPEPEYEPE